MVVGSKSPETFSPMQNLAWGLKQIVVPLVPFFGLAIIRAFATDAEGIEHFQPTELAFAMFLLSVGILTSASRLEGRPEVRSAIISGTVIFILAFAGIFTTTVFEIAQSRTEIDEDVEELDEVLRYWHDRAPNSTEVTIADLYAADRLQQIDGYIQYEYPELTQPEKDKVNETLSDNGTFDNGRLVRLKDGVSAQMVATLAVELDLDLKERTIRELLGLANDANSREPDLGLLRVITFAVSGITILAAVGLKLGFKLPDFA